MSSRLGDLALKAVGILLMLAAAGFAVSKAPDRSLESLVPRWAPPPSDFIELAGQLVHYRDQGPASDPLPLVLLHGAGASLHTWEAWAADLAQTRRVVSVDLPGFGLTGPAADADYRDERYVAFTRQLLTQLRIDRAVLVGHALGGEIAWQVALADPARVAGLVLVDAAGHGATPETTPLGGQLARLPGLRHVMRWVLPRRTVEDSVLSLYGNPARVSAAVVDRYYELTLREGNRLALLRRLDQLAAAPVERLPELRVPTLILWGGRDRLQGPQGAEAFHRAIAGSRLVVFPALGHVPQEEDPAATLAALRDWLPEVAHQGFPGSSSHPKGQT